MPDILTMTNKELLKRYPEHVSRANGRTCVVDGVRVYEHEKPRPCRAAATLRVRGDDMCASHAKSLLNWELNKWGP